MGKCQLRLLKFAIKFNDGWHSYFRDQTTIRALNSLVDLGLIVLNDQDQFKLNNQKEKLK